MSYDLDKPLYTLTIGEFLDLQVKAMNPIQSIVKSDYTDKKYVHGLQGLADLLGCSKRTASVVKSSGKIDAAISQHGRKIIIDSELVLKLLRQ